MTSYWARWHDDYDRPGSSLQRRLAVVQRRVREALEHAPPGPITIVSLCAGQGRDLIDVLADHPRRSEVSARLVELDEGNVEIARDRARSAGLDGVEVVREDASTTGAYAGMVPAEIVLACGIFGNVSDADVRRTVEHLPMLVRRGGTVIWTRHRREPDLTTDIRRWLSETGFDELAFDTDDEERLRFGVGTARLAGPERPFVAGVRLFDFVGDGADARC